MSGRLKFAKRAAAVLFLGLTAQAGAQLATDSPFLAREAAGANGVNSDDRAPQLRGIASGPDGTQYCIYDPQKKTSAWVGLHEIGYPFLIVSADPAGEKVVLQTGDGRQLSLALRVSKVSSLAVSAAPGVTASPLGDHVTPELTSEQQIQQRKNDEMREVMARKRMERLEAIKSGTLPATPPQS